MEVMAVLGDIVEVRFQVVQDVREIAVLLLDTVCADDYVEGRKRCEPVLYDKPTKVKEQGFAFHADAIGRVQNIDAFCVRLPARQQEPRDPSVEFPFAPLDRLWTGIPYAVTVFHIFYAPIVPRTDPNVSHRCQQP